MSLVSRVKCANVSVDREKNERDWSRARTHTRTRIVRLGEKRKPHNGTQVSNVNTVQMDRKSNILNERQQKLR